MPASEPAERAAIAADPAWEALGRELDLWAEAGRRATLWWRDDDAAELTPALERLLGLQAEHGVPLALAVIPDRLAPGLTLRLAGREGVVVLQHGWRHRDHAGKGEGAWELGDHRPLEQVAADLVAGQQRLAQAFGERFLPVLAPPWNRISGRVVQRLPALGFIGLSTFRARDRAMPAQGLVQVNAHCDPITWRGGARFASTGRSLDDLTLHLRARRMGTADPGEPTGLVTHHLAMDAPAWAFVAELLRRTRAHPRAAWQSAREVFRR
jgi:peptidoglycan/xylan/chitin deacetylase (PgdA/CDA1 family)